MNRRVLLWLVPALFYAAFFLWYTDLGGPLSPEEIDVFEKRMAADGVPVESRDRLRRFMESDTGRQFIMVNIIDYADDPPDIEGANPGESAQQLMDRYMEHMYVELFIRASHPVSMGNAFFRTFDVVGLEGVDHWDFAALMRYRSRRTLMEIVANPKTRGRHEFKVAALDKTIAFPVEMEFYLSDPRVLLGLILLSITSLLDLALYRRGRPTR